MLVICLRMFAHALPISIDDGKKFKEGVFTVLGQFII